MKLDQLKLDEFTIAYIETALWATNDNATEQGGEPLDENYSVDDISPETIERIKADCAKFQLENAEDIATFVHPQYTGGEMAGGHFFLTRCGHGITFKDGDWPKGVEDRLYNAAKKFGNFDLYIGDDKKIYHL